MPEELSLKNTLAVMGDEDIVLGFKALGFKTYVIKEAKTFNLVLEEILRQNLTICLLQDDIYRANLERINEYKMRLLPIFIPFSKSGLNLELLENLVRNIRLRATGAF